MVRFPVGLVKFERSSSVGGVNIAGTRPEKPLVGRGRVGPAGSVRRTPAPATVPAVKRVWSAAADQVVRLGTGGRGTGLHVAVTVPWG